MSLIVQIQPPSYCESAACYTPQQDRLLWASIICQEGVQSGLEVAPGAGMNVSVQDGRAFIQGDTQANEGMYWVASTDVEILPVQPADPTDPRRDRVVAQINPDCTWALTVITGTPSPNPVLPQIPASAVGLAIVEIPANATSVTVTAESDRAKVCQDLANEDTDWVPISQSEFEANWTTLTSAYRIINGLVQLDLQATWTGATVPSNASGNIVDIPFLTIPSAARPQHQRVPGDFTASSPGSLMANVNGTVDVTHIYPNGSLNQNSTLVCTLFWYRT